MEVKTLYTFTVLKQHRLLVTGNGDVAINSRRGIMGAICVNKSIAYHLFKINTYASPEDEPIKLCRKSHWSPLYQASNSKA